MSEAVLYETRGPAAWVTLNRPEKLNALNGAVLEGLHAALDRAVADDDVKVVVVTGSGERAFSAGYDLSAEAERYRLPEAADGYSQSAQGRLPCPAMTKKIPQ